MSEYTVRVKSGGIRMAMCSICGETNIPFELAGVHCAECNKKLVAKACEKYPLKHFIDKFSAIPEDQWCVGMMTDSDCRHCALGHCGVLVDGDVCTEEALALKNIADTYGANIFVINDGKSGTYTQATPKQRILAFLTAIQENKR